MVQKKKAPGKSAAKSAKQDSRRSADRRVPVKAAAKAKGSAKPVVAKADKSIVAKPVRKPEVVKPPIVAHAALKKLSHPKAASGAQPGVGKGALGKAQPKLAAGAQAKPPVPSAKVVPSVAVPRAMPAALGKPAAPKLTAPATPPKASVTPKQLAEKAAAARQQQLASAAGSAASKKPVSQRHGFKTSEFIVYPAHGVGRIVGIEEQEIAGISLELFVIQFEKDKMTLRVPTGKSQSVGMRKLADDGIVKKAMETLKGKARIKRTMWSRRAQEYEAKINSGDLISIAEVVRDLYRSETQPEQSYSERQLYEAALDRMAREIAAVEKLDERGAMQRITEVLSKSAKGRRMAEEASSAEVKAA
jgi:CarD family transcriptional regulator